MKIKNYKLKINSSYFHITILITAITLGIVIVLINKPYNSTLPDKRYSASLKDVHNLPVEGQKIVRVKKDNSNKQTNNYSYSYKMNGQTTASLVKNNDQKPSYALSDNNNSLAFSLNNKASNPKITDNVVEYETIIEEIPMTMRLTTSENKIKEEFVIRKKEDIKDFFSNCDKRRAICDKLSIPFQFNMENLGMEKGKDGIVFTSKDGKTKWTIPSPTLVDTKGKTGKITHEIKNNIYSLILDSNFLIQASYPVTIDPTVVINTSSTTAATQPSTMRHIVRTSDGTLHSFIQVGTQTATCAVGGSKSGLLWFNSTDSGATWNCQDQLSSDTTNLMYADARVDSSDNIYVVYSQTNTPVGASEDVFYRKITYNGPSSWALQSAQTVLDGTASIGYQYAVIELESSTRLWIAARYTTDNLTYNSTVYYSSNQENSPIWTQSVASLRSTSDNNGGGVPAMVRYGSKIGIVYRASSNTGFRFRSDSDPLTSWVSETIFSSTQPLATSFTVISDSNGHLYYTTSTSSGPVFNYFNGNTWSSSTAVVSTTGQNSGTVSLSTDGASAWIFYKEASGLNNSLDGVAKLVYKKCAPPFTTSDCDTSPTPVVSYQDIFNQVWLYNGSTYEDKTTAAGNTTTADINHSASSSLLSAIGDIAYFGQITQFDAISWVLSTAGTTGVIQWEYCSGVDGSNNCNAWTSLTFTQSANTDFLSTTGNGKFTTPGDWVAGKVNGDTSTKYYLRARTTTGFGTKPVGTQFTSIPAINGVGALSTVISNSTHLVWTENAASPTKVRYTGLTTTASTTPSATSEISPSVAAYSSTTQGTQPSTMRHIIKTSDGTIHAFVQGGTQSACGGAGGNNSNGLVWINSTDNGTTWTCQGQLSSDTSNLMYADARVDSSDNIYVVYSITSGATSASYDIYYRKISYNGSFSWTLNNAQKVLDSTGSGTTQGYSNANIELEGTTRAWVAIRHYDGTNYQVGVYYSDSLGTAPTWTVSQATLDTAGSTTQYHYPTIVRFGSKIGVIYNDQASGGDVYWRYRDDADGLTSWASSTLISTSPTLQVPTFSAATSGTHIYLSVNDSSQGVDLYTYNGSSWVRTNLATSATAAMSTFSSVSTDGTNAWVYYGQTTGLSTSLSGARKLVYKKCTPPFTSSDCDTTATPVVSYHGVFDKLWSYTSTTSAYLDQTTQGGNTTSNDTQMVGAVDDVLYFGKTEKFDAISWDVSRVGTTGVVTWEYWNGSTWMTLTDYLAASNTSFTADGYHSFIPHTDWATTTVNGEGTPYYYVRARVTTSYAITPFGVEFAAIPQISWGSSLSTVTSNTIPLIWTENAAATTKIRYAGVSVTASSTPAATAEIDPKVIAYSSTTLGTQPSTMRHTVRTSDGTLHAFVQAGTQLACGGAGGNNNNGLMWINSTDNGATWNCQGQLSSDTTNPMYADARVDTSDNIYVVYSVANSGASASYDVFYRKLTKGAGATWTLEAAQTVLDGDGSGDNAGFSYATIELEGTTRTWIAVREYDGANYNIDVYYSDGVSTSPMWTESISGLANPSSSSSFFYSVLVRFGSKIGIIYTENPSVLKWRYRSDSDSLTSWVASSSPSSTSISSLTFGAVGDTNGNIYFAASGISSNVIFTYYNGAAWSSTTTISSAATSNSFSSITTDGKNVWVVYGETTGLSTSLSGSRKLVYKRGVAPFATANFDTTATTIVPYHDTFKKLWSYTATTSAYLDQTTPGGNITSADTQMVGASGDILYLGSANKFDSISWDVSRVGTTGVVAWEYWNGSTWMSLTDFHVSSGSTFTADGYLSFIPHTDWATTKVNTDANALYYVRARVTTNYGIAPFGVQFAAIPQINWASATPLAFGSKIGLIWTENAGATTRIRYTPINLSRVKIQRGTYIRGKTIIRTN